MRFAIILELHGKGTTDYSCNYGGSSHLRMGSVLCFLPSRPLPIYFLLSMLLSTSLQAVMSSFAIRSLRPPSRRSSGTQYQRCPTVDPLTLSLYSSSSRLVVPMADNVQGESFSKLRRGYKPVMTKQRDLQCPHGCMGRFRTEWDRQQHMRYAHDVEEGATTIRSINEAVRNIGRTTPHDREVLSVNGGGPRKEGAWAFIPRAAQSLQPKDADRKSTKSGTSVAWSRGLKRVFQFPKKSNEPPPRSARFKQISNPIPHPSLLEDVDRIGTDISAFPRNLGPFSSYPGNSRTLPSTITRQIDNPIQLEEKDFDSASDSDQDYSPSSSVPPISTPPDIRTSLPIDPSSKDFDIKALPLLHIQTQFQRPSAPSSPHGSFSRPTPSAYPLLFRMSLESQEISSPVPRSPLSSSSCSLPSPRIQAQPLSPRPRPPVPSRNPARLKPNSVSESGHAPPIAYRTLPNSFGVRRSVSHSGLRI